MKLLYRIKQIDKDTRNIYFNTSMSFVIKVLSLFLGLFTTPAYIDYFSDSEILGLWFTILSVLSWILNFDMGIENGLRNRIVKSIINNDKVEMKKYISSAYIFLTFIALIILIILISFSNSVNWNIVFHIDNNLIDAATLKMALLILLISILMQFILRLITSILYAMQIAFIPSLLTLITNLSMFVFVIICNRFGLNNDIIRLAFFYLISVNIPLLFCTLFVFSTILKDSKPSFSYFKKEYALSVLKLGGLFLWLQFMSMILNNTNSYLISIFIDNSAVVEYQLYYKIFSIIGMLLGLVTASVWSAVTKAKEEKNYFWMNNFLKKISIIGVIAICIEFSIILLLQFVFNVWLGDNTFKINYFNAIVFALNGSTLIWSSIISSFLNGLQRLKKETIWLTIGTVFNIPLAYIFSLYSNNYISIVIANIISISPYLIICTIDLYKYLNKLTLKEKNKLYNN